MKWLKATATALSGAGVFGAIEGIPGLPTWAKLAIGGAGWLVARLLQDRPKDPTDDVTAVARRRR